jgi:uncharacterized membrane protein YdjX (TVP38/TMEM64 family)
LNASPSIDKHETGGAGDQDARRARRRSRRWLLAWGVGALVVAVASWRLSAAGWISWAGVEAGKAQLDHLVGAHPLAAPALFVAAYVATALVLCPAQLWLIILGAFLFGLGEGMGLSWLGAMIGAAAVFLAGRRILRDAYSRQVGSFAERARTEFDRDSPLYMLALRWLPVSPYFVANTVPALLGARLAPYLAVAAVGVLPDVITYSVVGEAFAGLTRLKDPGDPFQMVRMVTPVVFVIGTAPIVVIVGKRLAAAARRKPAVSNS